MQAGLASLLPIPLPAGSGPGTAAFFGEAGLETETLPVASYASTAQRATGGSGQSWIHRPAGAREESRGRGSDITLAPPLLPPLAWASALFSSRDRIRALPAAARAGAGARRGTNAAGESCLPSQAAGAARRDSRPLTQISAAAASSETYQRAVISSLPGVTPR